MLPQRAKICKRKNFAVCREIAEAPFFSKKLPATFQRIMLRKLMMIDNAENLNDLRVPPNNRLEALHGDREGQHSIRINDQYWICFREENGNFYEVEICGYH